MGLDVSPGIELQTFALETEDGHGIDTIENKNLREQQVQWVTGYIR